MKICYGLPSGEVLSEVRKLEKAMIREVHALNHVVFLKRCQYHGLVPVGFRLSTPFRSGRSVDIIKQAERSLVKERLRFWHGQVRILKSMVCSLKVSVRDRLGESEFQRIMGVAISVRETAFQEVRSRHLRKFEGLVEASRSKDVNLVRCGDVVKNSVVNLSGVELSSDEVGVLEKGLNFVVSPRVIPIIDVITGVEEAVWGMSRAEAGEVIEHVKCVLYSSKIPSAN